MLWSRIQTPRPVRCDDYVIILALMVTIALVAQTTWAIVDEGQDSHESEVSKTKIALIVRVGLFNPMCLISCINISDSRFW